MCDRLRVCVNPCALRIVDRHRSVCSMTQASHTIHVEIGISTSIPTRVLCVGAKHISNNTQKARIENRTARVAPKDQRRAVVVYEVIRK